MELESAFVVVIVSQFIITVIASVVTVQRHKVHIEWIRSEVAEVKETAARAHKRIDRFHVPFAKV